eukprot:15699822-Heterocapsa_arctica.AAC.1
MVLQHHGLIAVHEYRSDATQQQAIEKSKVHVSSIVSSICPADIPERADNNGATAIDVDRFSRE